MWQELRDYWLPMMLYVVTLFSGLLLLLVVLVTPFVAGYLPFKDRLIDLYTDDATVRRTSMAGALGLIVTAFVFFRPDATALRKNASSKKPPHDTMAGA